MGSIRGAMFWDGYRRGSLAPGLLGAGAMASKGVACPVGADDRWGTV
ncbi:MAG TPA: hypothetical protein IAB03_07580 [Candidatus Gallibacteroides avistercoris]|uniref:Uncharacterized protein n=1 Tax=Candidatus Gallibacteroides avistercoris TaxID=2840833 RepID=A0A9D1M8H7_9BACT|nr:hypothetical protein [Candidatus Gallibacteroides avistercoris]